MIEVSACSAYVKTTLEGVDGIGTVYDSLRKTSSDTKFKEAFMKDGKINSWLITRESSMTDDGQQTGTTTDTHGLVVLGYYGFEDGVSEPVLQALVDSVRRAFNKLSTRRFAEGVYWSGPMQAPSIYLANFGGKLCHVVRLTWPVQTINEE